MSSKMPPVPPGERSNKGPGSDPAAGKSAANTHPEPGNTSEKGETANVRQNTTNKGFFAGRRTK